MRKASASGRHTLSFRELGPHPRPLLLGRQEAGWGPSFGRLAPSVLHARHFTGNLRPPFPFLSFSVSLLDQASASIILVIVSSVSSLSMLTDLLPRFVFYSFHGFLNTLASISNF